MARTGPRRAPAFTLVELLVVLVIVLLVSAVTLPAILPALSHRQVSEAGRILQAALVQARDTAIRYNAPRGMRFLPDPTYFNKPGTTVLAYNRMVPIEPGPDYSNGLVTVWPDPAVFVNGTGWVPQPWAYPPPPYPTSTSGALGGPAGSVYPTYPPGHPLNPFVNNYAGRVLMIEQAPFQNNNANPPNAATNPSFVNAPTSWYWNVRVGDKLVLGASGGTYTIVGPCTVNPFNGGGNPELFVNVGQPGDLTKYLQRTYTGPGGSPTQTVPVEYLLLVNGIDDDGDGYTDEGWDGVDNNDQMQVNGAYQKFGYNTIVDDQGDPSGQTITTEWEPEKWLGIVGSAVASPGPPGSYTYDTTVSTPSSGQFSLPPPMAYTISRRPVPTQSARETMLPNNVVIDATTWNKPTPERSRLPVDPFSGYCDILLLPSGQVVPTTLYSNPASFNLGESFYQFWLAERQDVHEVSDLWGGLTNPNSKLSFLLPMTQDAYNNYIAAGNSFSTTPNMALTGERMLVTLFSRTGQITNNPIESFDVTDVNAPYYESQLATRDAK